MNNVSQLGEDRRTPTGAAEGRALAVREPLPLAKLLTASEVADILNVSYGWVKDHATRKQPHIPCVRVGDLLRFRPADIAKFIHDWLQ